MENKGIKIDKKIEQEEYDYELKSLECIKKFIAKKMQTRRYIYVSENRNKIR